MFFQKFASQK